MYSQSRDHAGNLMVNFKPCTGKLLRPPDENVRMLVNHAIINEGVLQRDIARLIGEGQSKLSEFLAGRLATPQRWAPLEKLLLVWLDEHNRATRDPWTYFTINQIWGNSNGYSPTLPLSVPNK
jgi:hypothetical protein